MDLHPTAHFKALKDSSLPWIEILSSSPRVSVYHNLLTPDECKELIALAGGDVVRSKVVAENFEAESDVRTSYGLFLDGSYMRRSPLLRELEERIAQWSHLPVENGEAFYLLRYAIGQQYKPHTDWFRDDEIGRQHLQGRGNRFATVLTYLQTPDEGGNTTFPQVGLQVPAKAVCHLSCNHMIDLIVQGDAVLFWNLTPDNKPDPMSEHAGKPVLKGVKWAVTKWIREKAMWRWDDSLSADEKAELNAEVLAYRKKHIQKLQSIKEQDTVTQK